ncbi:hypothetical protein ACFQJ5_10085 [Halomicroarcula sp. GCM10025324]|uniref:hypothetical protein n=1 Tax=Haloarcula TaxID=2237 RepID=UPI0023E7BA9A|nr:hypothetical protein [Halomicroarcula sp. ZS-22-S1]
MGQISVYKYSIPLEETEDCFESAYDYPEENVINKYKEEGYLIVFQDKVVPHFHKDSVAVKVDVIVEDEVESDAESS